MEQTSGMTSHHCYYCSPSIKLCQLPLNVKPGLLTNEKGHKLLETGSHSSYKVGSGSDLFFLQTHKKELRLQGHFPKVWPLCVWRVALSYSPHTAVLPCGLCWGFLVCVLCLCVCLCLSWPWPVFNETTHPCCTAGLCGVHLIGLFMTVWTNRMRAHMSFKAKRHFLFKFVGISNKTRWGVDGWRFCLSFSLSLFLLSTLYMVIVNCDSEEDPNLKCLFCMYM